MSKRNYSDYIQAKLQQNYTFNIIFFTYKIPLQVFVSVVQTWQQNTVGRKLV